MFNKIIIFVSVNHKMLKTVQQSFPLDNIKLHSDVDLLLSYPTLCVLSLLSLSLSLKETVQWTQRRLGKQQIEI